MDVEDVSNIYRGGQYRMEYKLEESNTHDLKTSLAWFGGQDLSELKKKKKKKKNNNWIKLGENMITTIDLVWHR